LTGYVQPLIDIDQLESLEVEANKVKKRDLENREELEKPKKKTRNKENNESERAMTCKSELNEKRIEEKRRLDDQKNVVACKQEKKRKKFIFQENGLGIKITKRGNGQEAKKGDRIKIRYIGQLDNETKKVFDKNLAEGLSLTLGRGEVIKGWDDGCQNIQLWEKRKIKIPSKLAYGKESLNGIPSNADLLYTVECIEIINN